MRNFLLKRVIRNKNFYYSLIIANGISIFYIMFDIYPNAKYGGSPYTRWIGSFTGSQIPAVLFMLLPIISAMGFSDTYLKDKSTGLLNIIVSKGYGKQYYKELFFTNFIVGGICFASSLLTNLYFCFMLLQDEAVDMLVNGNGNVPLLFSNTLFPQFYYDHPLLHIVLYLIIAFIISGIYASLALSLSFILSNSFSVFLAPFVFNYIYNILIPDIPESNSFLFTTFAKQISGPILSPVIVLLVTVTFFLLCILLYLVGIKRYENL
ncbi:hypothetical protein OL233_02570 [Vagococcus sp. PNs007]|uniref:ABC transporter permease n=2 Tax=Vagococcus proximus TaxID=2991417 RepID=A0ABT5WZH2_9ENTE|nr:hypothetical protein [Vagococcus proximus]